jgi:hypothetical protein
VAATEATGKVVPSPKSPTVEAAMEAAHAAAKAMTTSAEAAAGEMCAASMETATAMEAAATNACARASDSAYHERQPGDGSEPNPFELGTHGDSSNTPNSHVTVSQVKTCVPHSSHPVEQAWYTTSYGATA